MKIFKRIIILLIFMAIFIGNIGVTGENVQDDVMEIGNKLNNDYRNSSLLDICKELGDDIQVISSPTMLTTLNMSWTYDPQEGVATGFEVINIKGFILFGREVTREINKQEIKYLWINNDGDKWGEYDNLDSAKNALLNGLNVNQIIEEPGGAYDAIENFMTKHNTEGWSFYNADGNTAWVCNNNRMNT